MTPRTRTGVVYRDEQHRLRRGRRLLISTQQGPCLLSMPFAPRRPLDRVSTWATLILRVYEVDPLE